MFAVLKTGGKQYKVTAGDILRVEKIAALAGEKVQFNEPSSTIIDEMLINKAEMKSLVGISKLKHQI